MLSSAIIQQAVAHGQGHLVEWANSLPSEKQAAFCAEVANVNFAELRQIFEQSRHQEIQLDLKNCKSPAIVRILTSLGDLETHFQASLKGEEALRQGQIAIIMVAGGQGTRLGHDAPKGTYPIGPVTERSLFQIHAEKVLALSRRYGVNIPLLIMTSQENDEATKIYFEQHRWFGLHPKQVTFFIQGMLPALDAQAGQVLLKAPGEIALSPNGHGGVIQAMHQAGLLDQLAEQCITDCYYFQVDNPLVKIADPAFIGHHLSASAEMSLKVLAKLYPTERMGNLVELDGRCRIIEYTELPEELAQERMPNGELRIWAGSPAIHLFQLQFLLRLGRGSLSLPYHIARKAIPFVNQQGEIVKPSEPNALKFERFVFDALPLAERVVAVETSRAEEFEPLKNAEGENSPESVRRAMSDQYGRWLNAADIKVESNKYYEISPLVALDESDLKGAATLEGKWLSGLR